MNIFFTASIRGGRSHQPEYTAIVAKLSQYGNVHAGVVPDTNISQYGETHLSADDILQRELRALKNSDLVIAEVSTPSLGVGYLIAQATIQGKSVIALYRGDSLLKLSAMIKGDPLVHVHTYKIDQDIESILDSLAM